jgi:hypothetical protein
LTPLGQGGRTVLFEDVAAVEVTAVVEVVLDRGMGGGKLLESFHIPELRHRSFSSALSDKSERACEGMLV